MSKSSYDKTTIIPASCPYAGVPAVLHASVDKTTILPASYPYAGVPAVLHASVPPADVDWAEAEITLFSTSGNSFSLMFPMTSEDFVQSSLERARILIEALEQFASALAARAHWLDKDHS